MTTASLALERPVTTQALDSPAHRLDRLAGGFLANYASPRTQQAYRADLADYFAYCRSHGADPLEADEDAVTTYARSLEALGRSASTVSRRLACLSGFYAYCQRKGAVAVSPVTHVKRPRISSAPSLGPDAGDLRALLDVAKASGGRDYALTTLLAVLGLRVAEACSATVADLGTDRDHRTLTITRKGGKRQTLPLPAMVADAVEACLDGRQEGTLLGVNQAGKAFGRDDAARALRRLSRRAAIAPVSPHALRHAAATQMLALGLPLHRVQDCLGHSSPVTTRRYDDLRHSLDGHAAYAFADALSRKPTGRSAATASMPVRFTSAS